MCQFRDSKVHSLRNLDLRRGGICGGNRVGHFIQSIMVAPSLEAKAVVPPGLVIEVIRAVETGSMSWADVVDKGKGVYAPPSQEDTVNKAQGDRD